MGARARTVRRSRVLSDAPPYSAGVGGRGNSTVLHDRGALVLGRFDCPPGDPLWEEPNLAPDCSLVAFPGPAVRIRRRRADLVADGNCVVLYEPGETYERRLVDRRGDHCLFLRMPIDAPLALAARHAWATIADERLLRLHLLARALLRGASADPLAVDELLVDVVRHLRAGGGPVERSTGGAGRHRELVDDVLVLLARRLGERLTLADIGAELDCSPYHLARVFRETTGSSLHAYRHRLRLRAALSAVAAGADDLAGLAADLGFASHSHLTDSFRRAFGVAPSRVRTILEAEVLGPP